MAALNEDELALLRSWEDYYNRKHGHSPLVRSEPGHPNLYVNFESQRGVVRLRLRPLAPNARPLYYLFGAGEGDRLRWHQKTRLARISKAWLIGEIKV